MYHRYIQHKTTQQQYTQRIPPPSHQKHLYSEYHTYDPSCVFFFVATTDYENKIHESYVEWYSSTIMRHSARYFLHHNLPRQPTPPQCRRASLSAFPGPGNLSSRTHSASEHDLTYTLAGLSGQPYDLRLVHSGRKLRVNPVLVAADPASTWWNGNARQGTQGRG